MSGRDAAYASGRRDGAARAAEYIGSGASMWAPDARRHLLPEDALCAAQSDGSLAVRLGLTATECAARGDAYRHALTDYIAGWDDAVWDATVEAARAAGLFAEGGAL